MFYESSCNMIHQVELIDFRSSLLISDSDFEISDVNK